MKVEDEFVHAQTKRQDDEKSGGEPQGEAAAVITEEDCEKNCEEVSENEACDEKKNDEITGDESENVREYDGIPEDNNAETNKNESELIAQLVTRMKIEALIFWEGLDWFGKIFTVSILITILMFLSALFSYKFISVIVSVVQAGVLILAQLLHKDVLKCKKRNLQYLVLLVAVIVAVANLVSYTFANDATISTHSEKEEREGFDEETNVEVQVGNYTFSVPDYWEAEEESENLYQAYAEDSDKVVKLQIDSVEDDEDPVSFEILEEETDNGKMASAVKSYFDATSKVTSEYFESGKIKGYIYSFEYEKNATRGIGRCLVFPSGKNNHWVYVVLLENDYSDYAYFGDYDSIINSIKQKKVSKKSKKTTKKESKKKDSKKEEKNHLKKKSRLHQKAQMTAIIKNLRLRKIKFRAKIWMGKLK